MLALLFGDQTMIWNGESHSAGVGWVSTKDAQKIEVLKTGGFSGSTFVRSSSTKINSYSECGWQPAPWSPEFEGLDLSGYSAVQVAVRITGKKLPTDFQFSLRSPGDHHLTNLLSVREVEPKIFDGKWHVLHFPLTKLYFSKMKFDPKHWIQIIFGTWNAKDIDFSLDFDDLVFIRKSQ